MNVVFDTTILTPFLKPDVAPPKDPHTDKPVDRAAARIEFLLVELEQSDARVLIPTPVLAELLAIAHESGPDYLTVIADQAFFEIAAFDAVSAVEAGLPNERRCKRGIGNSSSPAVGNA